MTLPEVGMVTILQVLRGWSDSDLVGAALDGDVDRDGDGDGDGDAGGRREIAEATLRRANAIRNELTGLIYRPEGERRLTAAGWARLPLRAPGSSRPRRCRPHSGPSAPGTS